MGRSAEEMLPELRRNLAASCESTREKNRPCRDFEVTIKSSVTASGVRHFLAQVYALKNENSANAVLSPTEITEQKQ